MVYKNTRTGMVIQTTGKVTGKDWKPVEEKKASTEQKAAADQKPATDKKPAKTGKK